MGSLQRWTLREVKMSRLLDGHTTIGAIFDKDPTVNQTFVQVARLIPRVHHVIGTRGLLQDANLVLPVAGEIDRDGTTLPCERVVARRVPYLDCALRQNVSQKFVSQITKCIFDESFEDEQRVRSNQNGSTHLFKKFNVSAKFCHDPSFAIGVDQSSLLSLSNNLNVSFGNAGWPMMVPVWKLN